MRLCKIYLDSYLLAIKELSANEIKQFNEIDGIAIITID